MRTITTTLAILLANLCTFAQTPNKISYQAVIRNSVNALVMNQAVGMKISILQGSASGSAVYIEKQTPTTNSNGLVSLEIGAGIAISGVFGTIVWANGPYFLKTEIDPSGNTNYSISGTSQLLSVPYALHAKTAESISSSSGFSHYLGERFGGGVIFHLWKDSVGVEHGLIVAITNQYLSGEYSNVSNNVIGLNANSSWDGLSNSNAIVGQTGHTSSVAKICLDLVSGGQSDWYLPSIDELSLLWHNRFNVNRTLSSINGATTLSLSYDYWSSTESTASTAWCFIFMNGSIYDGYNKNNGKFVCPIRTF